MAKASVFADVTNQALTMGDSLHAALSAGDIRGELADLVSGRVIGRSGEDEIIIFDSTGTAIEDVASAAVAYERAVGPGVASIELAGA
jgi:ornithine cyclodeaminase/alanine dehydrogenase-like protein (mu-crystallin family)